MSDMLERNPQIKHLMEAGELVPDVSLPTHACLKPAPCLVPEALCCMFTMELQVGANI